MDFFNKYFSNTTKLRRLSFVVLLKGWTEWEDRPTASQYADKICCSTTCGRGKSKTRTCGMERVLEYVSADVDDMFMYSLEIALKQTTQPSRVW